MTNVLDRFTKKLNQYEKKIHRNLNQQQKLKQQQKLQTWLWISVFLLIIGIICFLVVQIS